MVNLLNHDLVRDYKRTTRQDFAQHGGVNSDRLSKASQLLWQGRLLSLDHRWCRLLPLPSPPYHCCIPQKSKPHRHHARYLNCLFSPTASYAKMITISLSMYYLVAVITAVYRSVLFPILIALLAFQSIHVVQNHFGLRDDDRIISFALALSSDPVIRLP